MGISIQWEVVTDVLIWVERPVPDGPIICWNDHLVNKGRNPRVGTSIDQISPLLGSAVPGTIPVVWLSLGEFPFNHRLTPAEGQILADYLAAGGSLYIEGGDVAFGGQSALSLIDGVTAIDNGDLQGSVPGVTGLDTGLGIDATQLSAPYRGRSGSIDHLVPDGNGAAALFQNAGPPGQTTAVYYDANVSGAGTHRIVTSSTTIEGYDGDESALLDALLDGLSPSPAITFTRGDGNGDGAVDIGDPIYSLAYLFNGGDGACLDAQDSNDDGSVDIGDPVYSLSFSFSSGPPPLAPWPNCGSDPTTDGLSCLTQPSCP
ncbi:MAG: hypothetical protein AAF581_02300 [Planctomycetota bacterium]